MISRSRFAASLIAALCLAASAEAIFIPVEIRKVPIERLTANLSEAVRKNPKDADAMVNLARVHAMAYSLRSDELPTKAENPKDVWFGFEPKLVPFSLLAKSDDPKKLEAAKKHLQTALDLYSKAVELRPDDLKARLGHAWLLSQTEKKDDAIAALRKVIELGWEKDRKLQVLGLGGHTITGEGIGYLIPLLDAKKDAEEIAKLMERTAMIAKLPRPVTPIAIPLKDGLAARDLENRTARVPFDADGSGPRNWTWIHGNSAAWLVHDPKRSGKIGSGLQLFGNVTFWLFWDNGYAALAALDDNGDGRLAGSELEGLALWHDANGNGVSDPGEVKPLADHGITGLSCRFERDASHPDRIAYSKAGVTFANGRTRQTFDIVLHPAR